MKKRVVIVHGWSGSPQSDFFPWLKKELEKKDYEIIIPAMPETDCPKIENWIPYLAQVVGKLRKDDIFVGHSIGCQTILRYLEIIEDGKKVGKVILIAPWIILNNLSGPKEWQIAKPWLENHIAFEKVKTKANFFITIFSDNDPFVPVEQNRRVFQKKLGAKTIVEHNKGHFNNMPQEYPNLLNLF